MPIPSQRWMLICSAMLLLLVASACGREQPEPESVAPATTELRLITDDSNSALSDALVELLEETHPELSLKYENWSNWPRSYMTADKPPDLMAAGTGDWIMSTIREGLVADISDVWEQANLRDSFPKNLQDLTMYNGKQYVLPIGYEWRGFYYNRAVFDQYGLTPPQTWDELMQIADTLVLNGEIPFSIAGRRSWAPALWFDYLNIRLNGPEYHNALIAGQIPYTDDGVLDVFFTWQFLFEEGYFVSNPGSQSELQSLTALVRGDKESPLNREKAVMSLSNPGEVDELPEVFKNELGVFAFPVIDPMLPRGEVLASFGYIVPANAPNRIAALNYLTFAASTEVQNLLTEYAGQGLSFIPAHLDENSNIEDFSEEIQSGWRIINAAEEVSLPIMWASPQPMRSAFGSAIDAFFRNLGRDTLDIDKILTELEEKRLEQLTQGVFDN